MGRDVTGLRVTAVKVKPNDAPQETIKPKVAVENNEAKDHQSKEGAAESSPVKNSNEKQDLLDVKSSPVKNSRDGQEVLGVKSTNLGAEKREIESAKAEDQKPNSPAKGLATIEKNAMKPAAKVEDQKSNPTGKGLANPEKHVIKPAKVEDQMSNSPEKATSPVPVVDVRTKQIAQKALDLEPDKRACVSPIAAETPMYGDKGSPEGIDFQSPISAKKLQPSSPFLSRKHVDDEDTYSLASSAASARTARSKTTVPVAPTFKIHERLEKRKEFYTKLEMKQKALEAEKQEYEARTKEEEAAAIKQLRKNMVVKANPVPSFYYKGPPPKKELKKLPTTRAVSPKLSRRKSYGDAVSSSSEEKSICARALRHSLGNYRESSTTPTSTPKKKDRLSDQNGNNSGKFKKSVPPKMTEQNSADIAVQS